MAKGFNSEIHVEVGPIKMVGGRKSDVGNFSD
jgi:hypothetical protein